MTEEQLTGRFGKPVAGLGTEVYWETGRMTRGSSVRFGKQVRFWKRWVWHRYADGAIRERYYRVYEGEPHWRPM